MPSPLDDLTRKQLAMASQNIQLRPEQSETILRGILSRDPDQPDALHLLGMALRHMKRADESLELVRRSVELRNDAAPWWNNLSIILREAGDLSGAKDAANRAIALAPDNPQFHYNLGHVLREERKFEEALKCYDESLRLDPNYAKGHYSRGITLLTLGDFENGWPEYEWRWRKPDYTTQKRAFSQPMWDRSNLSGKTILLYTEQGFGDTIQFARYAPLVAARGGNVILQVAPSLVDLMRSIRGVGQVLSTRDALPSFDTHAPLMSLPMIFHTTPATIPWEIPYLVPDAQKAEAWRNRLPPDKLRVGLCWSGSPKHGGDKLRSIPPDLLAPLAQIDRVAMISVQKDQRAPQLAMDFSSDLHTFADTAALIANLELVVTVDTSIAHLAGAMGKETWTLIPFSPDWRWMLNRADSPWYPTMRLFRENARHDWPAVVESVAREIRLLASERR